MPMERVVIPPDALEALLAYECAPATEVTYAERRLPDKTYMSKTFTMQFGQDEGQPARYIYKVFDELDSEETDENWNWTEYMFGTTPQGRKQFVLNVAREAGAVRAIRIQKVPTSKDRSKMEDLLTLNREQSAKLIDLFKALDSIPVDGGDTERFDDDVLHMALADPEAIRRIYESSSGKQQLTNAIQSDSDARDVIALQHRRDVVSAMQSWLDDDESFRLAHEKAGGPEKAWQQLLEAEPWVLGVGLSGKLLTSWSDDKLEQITTGRDIFEPGKRVDALLRTNGYIRSLVFAEIKHHKTELLARKAYRSGCWSASDELSGAITQAQRTVQLALTRMSKSAIPDKAEDGSSLGTFTYLVQPRSYLIIGNLQQLTGSTGGAIDEKVESFELLRSHLVRPEIITFDELVARARWAVEIAEAESRGDQSARECF